ncbi:hypothetical protein [Mangrovimonas sp. DI 80]|uniref:hypothetical protein n=1 Tax=Mangrovimonas sp. DI 80 TaxID=1779330 RepID=UPI00097886B8|nr:hypothetical protein [Mangrovimonas sp. DI 80]OMP32274.1 hypothetical protein BKM32_04275 [Mangrovimonas sp. DI 80]
MTLEHLEEAIRECNTGDLAFNNRGDLQCFLYKNRWYPMIAVVKRALEIANQPDPNLNSRNALFKLFSVLTYVRYQNIEVENNQLVDLTDHERLNEINYLMRIISQITEENQEV